MTTTRSSGTSQTIIFPYTAMLSGPALVRESEANTMPSSTRAATQYVIASAVNFEVRCMLRERTVDVSRDGSVAETHADQPAVTNR